MTFTITKSQVDSRLASVLPFKTLSRFFIKSAMSVGTPVFLALLLISPAAYSEDTTEEDSLHSGAGMINRAPFVSSKIKPSNLDRISTDISEITESLSNILTNPIEEEKAVTEIESIDAPVKPVAPIVAEPAKVAPKIIEAAKPVIPEITPQITEQKQAQTQLPVLSEPVANAPEKQAEIIAKKDIPLQNKAIKIRYLKKGSDGNALPEDASKWACVEDVENGLIWEVKSNDGSIHDKNNSFTWYQPEATEIIQGVADGGRCKGNSDCDTYAYIEHINQMNYCGYSNWRLPTKEEILSIVDFKSNDSVTKIDTEYFPDALPSWYWTASSNEDKPEYAWYVLFRNGITLNDRKERPKHIRLVRTDKEA